MHGAPWQGLPEGLVRRAREAGSDSALYVLGIMGHAACSIPLAAESESVI